jgi:hypothetical protein
MSKETRAQAKSDFTETIDYLTKHPRGSFISGDDSILAREDKTDNKVAFRVTIKSKAAK